MDRSSIGPIDIYSVGERVEQHPSAFESTYNPNEKIQQCDKQKGTYAFNASNEVVILRLCLCVCYQVVIRIHKEDGITQK